MKTRKSSRPLGAALIAVALISAACGGDDEVSGGDASSSAETVTTSAETTTTSVEDATDDEATDATDETESETEADGGALSVVDPRGDTISVEAPVERIVCLTGMCDDAAIELGLVPVATTTPVLLNREEFLGEADGSAVPIVPGFFGAEDVEAIAGFEPDLVIGLAGVHDGLVDAVEEFAPVWLVSPASVDDSIAYLEALAVLTDRTDEGAAAATQTREALADAIERAAAADLGSEVVAVMFGSSQGFGVDHAETLVGGMLAQLFDYPWPAKGQDPITAGSYSVEEILANEPGTIFAASFVFAPTDLTLGEQLADNPIWVAVPAVSEGRLIEVSPDLWAAGRGTRSLRTILGEALAAFDA